MRTDTELSKVQQYFTTAVFSVDMGHKGVTGVTRTPGFLLNICRNHRDVI